MIKHTRFLKDVVRLSLVSAAHFPCLHFCLVLFYVFAGRDLSGNRLLLVKELSFQTAAFPYFQVQLTVLLTANSRNAYMGA